jgi:hypothetical protein
MAIAGEVLDLLDPYLYSSDPWSVYKQLRDEAPVYRDRNGLWCISRYRDVLDIEKNTALYSSARGSRPLNEMSVSMTTRTTRSTPASAGWWPPGSPPGTCAATRTWSGRPSPS